MNGCYCDGWFGISLYYLAVWGLLCIGYLIHKKIEEGKELQINDKRRK